MVTAAEIEVIIKARNEASVQIKAMVNDLRSIDSAARSTNSMLQNIISTAGGFIVATGVLRGVGEAFDFLKGAVIGFNDQMQRSTVGFTSLLGSADAAKALLKDLQNFAEQTPFEFPGLVRAANRLLAMGLTAADIIPTLENVGNAVAASGQVSEEVISRVTLALGQMATKGRIQGEEMRQLTEAGIPAWRILADAMGVSTAKLQQMVEKGMVPADKNLRLLIEGMGDRAPNAMREMSTTFTGAMSNIRDALNRAIGEGFKPFFDAATRGTNQLVNFLRTPGFREFSKNVAEASQTVVEFADALIDQDWDQVLDMLGNLGGLIGGLLQDAINNALDIVGELAGRLVDMAPQMFTAGANIIGEFARGLIDTATSTLPGIMNSITSFIGDYLIGQSPPPKGVLSEIDKAGAQLLETYIQGMSSADLGVLEDMTDTINDILLRMFRTGEIEETDIITRLFGSQNALSEIINQFNEFGTVSGDVLSNFTSLLGESGDEAASLALSLLELSKTERDLEDLENQIGEVNKRIEDAERAYQKLIRPLQDALREAERFWDGQIKGADDTVRAAQRAFDALEKLRRPEMEALDDREAAARLSADEAALEEARRAPMERRLAIEKQIADERKKAKPDLERIAELTREAAEAGTETARDRLSVIQAERSVAEDKAEIEQASARRALRDAEEIKDALEDQKRDAIDPIKAKIDETNLAYERQKQLLEDERLVLEDRKSTLEAERDQVQEIIDKETARLDGLKLVSDELQKQQSLLDQIAKAAEAEAKKGGGGAGKGELPRNFTGLGFPAKPGPEAPTQPPFGSGLGEGMFDDQESFDFAEKSFTEKFQGMLTNIGEWIKANVNWGEVIGFAGPSWLAPVMLLFSEDFRGRIGDMLNSVKDSIGPAVDALGRKFVPGVESLADGFEQLVEWFVKTAVPGLAENAAKGAIDIATGLASWTQDFISYMVERTPAILEALQTLGSQLIDWVTNDAIPNTGTALVGWTNSFVDWIGPVWDQLLVKANELRIRVVNWIEGEGLESFSESLGKWTGAFFEWIIPVWTDLQIEAVKLLGSLTTWIVTEALPAIVPELAKWGLAFHEWVGPAILDLLKALAGLQLRFVAWSATELVPALATAFFEVGKSIIQGIWEGIKGSWEGLKQDLGGLLKGLPAEALKIIRGGSPSEEFVPVGESMGQGITKGYRRSHEQELMPMVRRSMNELVEAAEGMAEGTSLEDVFRDLFGRAASTIQEASEDINQVVASEGAEIGATFAESIGIGFESVLPGLLQMVSEDMKVVAEAAKIATQQAFNEALAGFNAAAAAQQAGNMFNPGGITGGGALTPNGGNILTPSAGNPFPYTPAMDNPGDIRSALDQIGLGIGFLGSIGFGAGGGDPLGALRLSSMSKDMQEQVRAIRQLAEAQLAFNQQMVYQTNPIINNYFEGFPISSEEELDKVIKRSVARGIRAGAYEGGPR